MRIFAAFPLPQSISSLLNYRQKLLSQQFEEGLINWVGRPDFANSHIFHITSVFLGNQDPQKVPVISAAMAEVVKDIAEIKVQLAPETWFGSSQYVKVIIRKVLGEINSLEKISDNLHESLAQKGNHGQYVPHVTLGRVRRKKRLGVNKFQRNLKKIPPGEFLNFSLKELVLYRSILDAKGVVYKKLTTIPLS